MDILSIVILTAIAACVVTGGVCYFLGLSEGRGEADAIAAKVVERMVAERLPMPHSTTWTTLDLREPDYRFFGETS